MFEVNNKTLERSDWRHSGVFIVNFEHISHFVLVFLLLALNKLMSAGYGLTFPCKGRTVSISVIKKWERD